MPILEFTQAENKDTQKKMVRQQILERYWEVILRQIVEMQKDPLLVEMVGASQSYRMKPVLYFITQDTKEVNTLCRHYQAWNAKLHCRICDVLFTKLLQTPFMGAFRTTAGETAVRRNGTATELNSRSMHGGTCPFAKFPDALGDTLGRGIYAITTPELLHQYEGGELKIAINATLAQLYPKQLRMLDTRMEILSRTSLLRLSRISTFSKLFPNGFTNMSKMNCKDYPPLAFALVLLIGE